MPAFRRLALPIALPLALLAPAAPASARDSLGVYGDWGAFRDPGVPRCYAIARARLSRLEHEHKPYAAIGTWPKRGLRGQVHFRLSRDLATGARIVLYLGGERFELVGGGAEAWAADKRMDAALVAAMRSATEMNLYARDTRGRRFIDSYSLDGAATALDAAAIGCARLR